MITETLTIRDVAERIADDPKDAGRNLARKIGYNLKNPKKAAEWLAVGIDDPGSVPHGKNDPFLKAFDDVLKITGKPWPTATPVERSNDQGVQTHDGTPDRSARAAAESDATKITSTESPVIHKHVGPGEFIVSPDTVRGLKQILNNSPIGSPTYEAAAKKYKRFEDQVRALKVGPNPVPSDGPKLSERMSPDSAFWVIVWIVTISDGVSAGLIYFVGLSDYPFLIQSVGAGAFGVVGSAVGYSAILNYLSIKDQETANLYAGLFACWQVALHTASVFSYIQFGQVVVYVGIALATVATIAAIKTR